MAKEHAVLGDCQESDEQTFEGDKHVAERRGE